MDNIREISYKIIGLSNATDKAISQLKADFSGVKGVIAVSVDAKEGAISYAIDQWASDYDVLCKLEEICDGLGLEVSFDSQLEDESTDAEECEIIEEDSANEYEPLPEEEIEDEPEKTPGKISKFDIIERVAIFGIALALLVAGIFIKNSNAKSWVLMIAFTMASYETLYATIVKASEKKYVLEEIMTFVGALVIMYTGHTTSASIIMLIYGLLAFSTEIATHINTVKIEKLEGLLEDATEEDYQKIQAKIDFLKSNDGVCDTKTAETVNKQLTYNVSAIILALLVSFIPPLFNIKQYGYELTSTWLYVGASVLLLATFGEIIFANLLLSKATLFNSESNEVRVNDYKKFISFYTSNSICLDKVGVLTEIKGEIVEIKSDDSKKALKIALSAVGESSSHIAEIIKEYCKNETPFKASDITEISGRGIVCTVDGKRVIVGNKKLLKENSISVEGFDRAESPVYICEEGKLLGVIFIAYKIKGDSEGAIMEIKEDLLFSTTILSSDATEQVVSIKNKIKCKSAVSLASPDFKAEHVKEKGAIYVGHGFADKETLERVDISIAFESGGTATIMDGKMRRVPFVLKLARRTASILRTNRVLAVAIKAVAFVAVVLLRLFTAIDFIWWIYLIEIMSRALIIFNSMRNESEVV